MIGIPFQLTPEYWDMQFRNSLLQFQLLLIKQEQEQKLWEEKVRMEREYMDMLAKQFQEQAALYNAAHPSADFV